VGRRATGSTPLGYIHTKSARVKVRVVLQPGAGRNLSEGRGIIAKELQRAGQTGANIEELAHKLGFAKADDLYIAAARGDLNQRQFQAVAKGGDLLLKRSCRTRWWPSRASRSRATRAS
jgi:GTP pyrophosphokinase